MIRVVIVDDEYLLRTLIKNSVNWNELGFEIVDEAEDGEEALRKIEESKPELMIVDINIPFINGLKLSEIIKESYPHIKVIILTGYEEFQYAKEAIEAGVLSYIVKPINSEELEQALLSAKKKITEELEQRRYLHKLETVVKDGYGVLRDKFLNSLISNPVDETSADFKKSIQYFKFSLSSNNSIVIVVEIDNLIENWREEQERKLWAGVLLEKADVFFNSCSPSEVFIGPDNRIVVITNDISCSSKHKKINIACEEFKDDVKNHLGFTVTIGIGGCCDTYNKIYLSFQEAVSALESKFYKGSDRIISYGSIKNHRLKEEMFVLENADEILIDLRIGNWEELLKRIDSIFEYIRQKNVQKNYVQIAAIELASIAVEYAAENNIKVDEVLKDRDDLYDIIVTKEFVQDIKEWVISFYKEILDFVSEKRKNKISKLVENAKKYIEENYYSENLTLEEIAVSLFVNPSYISNIFKKETGYSIIEYLTEYRLKKAKSIIDSNEEIQIIDIARQVGYSDPYYFSKCFKKYYGLSPLKYVKKKIL